MAAVNLYRVFTLDTWKNWEKTGKTEVIEKITHFIKQDSCTNGHSKANNLDDLSLALYDIVHAVTRGNLRRDHAKTVLLELLPLHPDMGSQLVEIISIIEAEIMMNTEKPSKQKDALLSFVKILDLEKLYKERLEIDTLGDAAILKNRKNFLVKQIKVRTKLFYKQQKFNLLREESEGYAKLITELNQEITNQITPSGMLQIIRSLIGCFNLDPNRVLDLILEAYECRPEEHSFYSSLLHLFPHEASTLSEIIGFKLNNTISDSKDPKTLYRLMALLLQTNLLQLSDIYDWLTPEDASMCEDHKREMEEAREFASRANVVSTKDKDKEKEKSEDDEDIGRYMEKRSSKFASNQKIQLCVALLKVGNWQHFEEMCSRFPDYYLVSCLSVGEALCNLINDLLQPLYKKHNGLPTKIKSNAEILPPVYPIPPLCYKFEDMSNFIFPMLCTLGPYIYHDVCLIYRILRVSRAALKELKENRGKWYYDFLSVLDECILPALSMFDLNPCIAEEIWETMKYYPYQHRYKLYGRWKNETYSLHPPLIRNRTLLLKKAKYVMMRITKETIKPVSRSIGKLSHDYPGPIFEYVLKQVQLYDNLITPVVDSFKYLTSLSYDVLGYCIVEILTLTKERTQMDAMAIAPWLQSLSSFTGSLCKKYSLDLGGILQFVANQLKAEKSIDLLILKEIVQKMGGTDSMANLTPEQIEAMCGGELLRKEAGQYLQEKNTKRSSTRLKECLMENDLAVPLLLLMAQQRSCIIYNQTESRHLKLVGKLYDQCQDTLVQFGSHLSQMVTIEELSNKLPPIGSLLSDYHITADVAFFLARPMFNHSLQTKYDELRRKDKSEKKLSGEDKKKIFMDSCGEVFSPIVELIRPAYNSKVWEDVDPWFFLTFWTLGMSDLEVPIETYEKENKKIAELITSKSRKRDIERLTSLKEKLEDEKKRQVDHAERVNAWLLKEKDAWFKQRTARSPKNDTVTTFLQLCVFPRCTFSTMDAIYCARFVRMLHSLKTPNFSTLLCYDRMYCDITYTVTSCTEQEAHHYARFLLGTLETVMYWHASSEHFEEECAKYPGFITRYRISKHEANDYVDYENFRHVVHKWHYKITKALVTCLESGNYIQIRNAIFILQGVLPCFPAIINLALVIEKRIEKVKSVEKNQRNDLYVLANSYSGRLKAKKPQLLPESEFHVVRRQDKSQTQKTPTDAVNGVKEEKPCPKKQIDPPSNERDTDADSKKGEKRKEDKDDKSKKKKETKRIKLEGTDEEQNNHTGDTGNDDDNATENNHDGGNINSIKMDPPALDAQESGRTFKRRKVDQETKATQKENDTRKDRKRSSRSSSSEIEDPSLSTNSKRGKREKKKSSPPVEEKKLRKSLRSH